jgi:hypothetical protein
VVASRFHRDRNRAAAAALVDDDVLDGRGTGQRFVRNLLQLHDSAAAISAVGRDEQPRLGVVDAVAQRLGAESAEHDAVNGADARTRQHRDRELGDERHDGDAIALLRAERFEHVRELRPRAADRNR